MRDVAPRTRRRAGRDFQDARSLDPFDHPRHLWPPYRPHDATGCGSDGWPTPQPRLSGYIVSASIRAQNGGWRGRIRTFDLLIQSQVTDLRDSSLVLSTKPTDFSPPYFRV